jgi:D-arabinose 1-dehydrogenase-like Zn-dependent alcohol dehydrogenase
MAETARMAVFHGAGKPFQIREYPVPDPEPGAILIKVAMANVCGSDLHYWRGELDYVKMGRPLPLNTGHEHVGRVAKLGSGVTTDSAGRPLAVGDRVAYRFFFPCGRCRACLRGKTKSCPVRQANFLVSCEAWPHFQGGFGEYFYLRPNHAVFKLADDITDDMAAGVNCAFSQVYAGLDLTALRQGQTVVIQGAGGLGVYACAVAREMGAARVIIIDGVEERLALARAFGATDFVGYADVIPEGLRMLRGGGCYLEVGSISPGNVFSYDATALVRANARLVATSNYSPWALEQSLSFMRRNLKRFPFDKVISHVFPLERISEAFARADWAQRGGDPAGVSRAAISM